MFSLFKNYLHIILNQIECKDHATCENNNEFCNAGVCRENTKCTAKKICQDENQPFGKDAICRKGVCFSNGEIGLEGMYIMRNSYNAPTSHMVCLLLLTRSKSLVLFRPPI